MRTDAPENNIGERAFDMPETQQLLYVFPALLAEVDPHSYDVPQFAPSGLIKLEKSFELPKFAPIALIPKIMAKLFSRTSRRQQDFQVDETASSSSVDINKDKCQCFQTCFVQTIGERTLWVYLDHYNSSSPDTGLISPVSPSSVKHHYAYSMASQSFDSSVSYTLRIVVFDYLFSVQQGVSELHDIQDIVIDVLQSYKGLGKVNIISYCPVCLMQQLPYSSSTFTCCGVISEEVERKVMQELNNLVEACITDQYNNEPESDIYAQFQLWEARKESICTNKCKFKADFYIPLPKDIIDHKTSYCVAHEIELYLSAYYSDILGDCSDFDSSPCSGASYSPSICHPNEVSSMNSPIKPIVHLGSQCDRIGLALVKVACLKCDQDALCKLEQFRTSAITSSKLVSASREFELSGISFHTLIDDQISYFVYTMQPRNFNHKQDAWFLVKGKLYYIFGFRHYHYLLLLTCSCV
ncbi:hypothetical protein EON65_30555 [archaeon]|nr:MAG: hypothetical protein EON65_30555 [archaeon]